MNETKKLETWQRRLLSRIYAETVDEWAPVDLADFLLVAKLPTELVHAESYVVVGANGEELKYRARLTYGGDCVVYSMEWL